MKHFLRHYLPDPQRLRAHKHLRFLGELLHDPRLWHFNRRSTVRGLAAGMFCAFVPLPWQMLLAAMAAAWLRFNLPVAVAMVWITNPVTIPPIFYGNYRFGAWLLGRPTLDWAFEPSASWLLKRIGDIGWPLLIGSLVMGVIAAAATFVIAHLLWRWHIVARFRNRHRTACSA